jgi:hypothetical protein
MPDAGRRTSILPLTTIALGQARQYFSHDVGQQLVRGVISTSPIATRKSTLLFAGHGIQVS